MSMIYQMKEEKMGNVFMVFVLMVASGGGGVGWPTAAAKGRGRRSNLFGEENE